MTSNYKGTILIVDDTETNIDILMEALGEEFELSVALDGESALELVEEVTPDLILLDIMMPGIDGYEVCRQLKTDKIKKDIPIIFLTAMSDADDEAKGLELGAMDYITKPFNPELVKARVRNQLAMRRYQLELIEQKDRIEDDYHKIRELEKLRDDLASMIIHDMRNPLTSIMASLSIFLRNKSEDLQKEDRENIEIALDSTKELNEMITSLLDISRLESGKMPLIKEKTDLKALIKKALKQISGLIAGRNFKFECNDDIPTTLCDPGIIERVVVNMVSNALKFTPEDGKVTVELAAEPQWNRITFTDTGPGIPREYHEKIFEKFGQAELRKHRKVFSSGLGLTFCKLAVNAHGGSIVVESEPGKGAKFHILLPKSETDFLSYKKLLEPEKEETPRYEKVIDAEMAARKDIKVFVVDDNRHITQSLKRYFDIRTEWSITEINDSKRVIRKALKIKPDLVIMDVDMPEISGTEIAEELFSTPQLNEPAIIYFTGLITPEEAGETGISDKFGRFPMAPKGLPLAKLLSVLIDLLEEREKAGID